MGEGEGEMREMRKMREKWNKRKEKGKKRNGIIVKLKRGGKMLKRMRKKEGGRKER